MNFRSQIEEHARKMLDGRLPAGLDHFSRVYQTAKKLSDNYDDEVLHAAVFLHDVVQDEEPHNELSAESAEKFLKGIGFPSVKISQVVDAIKNHVPTGKPKCTEAKMLHDADQLDFLGATGIARLSGITAQDWFEIDSLKELNAKIWGDFCSRCANSIILENSKELAENKIRFLNLARKQLDLELK